jgi:hypothetical protein
VKELVNKEIDIREVEEKIKRLLWFININLKSNIRRGLWLISFRINIKKKPAYKQAINYLGVTLEAWGPFAPSDTS